MDLNTIKNTGNWGSSASRLNENFSKVGTEVDKLKYAAYNSKLYASEALLKQAIPSPSVGDWAIVGNAIPGEIYRCDTDGEWTATGQTGGGYGMEVTEKHVTEQYVTEVHNEYTGDIVNNPDDEDLISEEKPEGAGVIKFADKLYNMASFSGLGRVYLRKNISGGKNLLTQTMITGMANTRFIVQYDYDLNGETIAVPKNCVLDFQGGKFYNGTIVGDNTSINASFYNVFGSSKLVGTWNVEHVYPEWFGAKGDGISDDTDAFQYIIDNFNTNIKIKLLNKTYCISSLSFYNRKDISIIGANDSPVASLSHHTSIKAIAEVDYLLNLTSPGMDEAIETTHGFTLKDVIIECDNKASVGIRCRYLVYLDNVSIRRATYAGLLLEDMFYPVLCKRLQCGWNKNGIVMKGPMSTVSHFEQCEIQFNTGWGIVMNGGVGVTFDKCLVQSNWVGGIKMEMLGTQEQSHWLYNILFISLYTENNGLRANSDSDYEGNYTLYIKGISTNPAAFAGKISNITFLNCSLNKPASNPLYFCEGTYGLKCINCTNVIVPDRTKNMYYNEYFSRINCERVLTKEGVVFSNVDTNQVYNNILTYYGESWTTLKCGSISKDFEVINEVNCSYVRIGHMVRISGTISYNSKNGESSGLLCYITGLPFNVLNQSHKRCICGTFYILGESSGNSIVHKGLVTILDEGNYASLNLLPEDNIFTNLTCAMMPNSGRLSFELSYITGDN